MTDSWFLYIWILPNVDVDRSSPLDIVLDVIIMVQAANCSRQYYCILGEIYLSSLYLNMFLRRKIFG